MTRSRRALVGWLTAEAVSLTGTRVSMVAVPWLVLTTTGSASRTGLVAFAEMAPYVLAKATSGPWVDRLGPRRIAIATDVASVAVVGAVPLLHAMDALAFPVLLLLMACAGALRGPGDGARSALVPTVVEASGVPLERATGLSGAVERLASTVGAAFAGLLVALVGPAQALVLDAASFGVAAAVLAATTPRPAPRDRAAERPGYRAEMSEGWRFLRGDRVLVALAAMVAVTNLLDAAFTAVLLPVWAERSGGGATAIGLVLGCFSATAVLGSLVASAYGGRLPRFATYVTAFLLCGAPRFAALALPLPLPAVLGIFLVGGFGCGFINPILAAVTYERIPLALLGRVSMLTGALAWAGIPLGGLAGGLLVSEVGLTTTLVVVGTAYLVATLAPVLDPAWRGIDERPGAVGGGSDEAGEPEGDLALR